VVATTHNNSIRNLVDQNRYRDKCFLQKVEIIIVGAIGLLRNVLLNEACWRNDNI